MTSVEASTSFANPAVTLARSLTDTFTGIRPADVPGFIGAQMAGAAAATALFQWVVPAPPRVTPIVVAGTMRREAYAEGADMTTVLFACTHNAGRSQMAAAFFNAVTGSEERD